MASIARAVPREIVGAQCEGMRTASDGLQIEQSWSAQMYPGDFWSEIMQIMQFTLIMQFIAIMQVCTNTRTNNDAWKSLSILCTFIWLLSSGSAGMSRLAWDSAWYSKKYRPSLSGSTDSILYAPYSPHLPCRINSHGTATLPTLCSPPLVRRCVNSLRFVARSQILHQIPKKLCILCILRILLCSLCNLCKPLHYYVIYAFYVTDCIIMQIMNIPCIFCIVVKIKLIITAM